MSEQCDDAKEQIEVCVVSVASVDRDDLSADMSDGEIEAAILGNADLKSSEQLAQSISSIREKLEVPA